MNDAKVIIEFYKKGILTQREAVCRLAHIADAKNINQFMHPIPFTLKRNLKKYIEKYSPGNMIFIGGNLEVSPETLLALRQWFKDNNIDG